MTEKYAGIACAGIKMQAEMCDKLEKALELAVRDSDKTGTDVWCHDCPYGDNERLDHCCDCGIEYYKRKAGIDS